MPSDAFLGPRIAIRGFAVLAAAFGLNFAAGQFFAPLGREEGLGVAELSAAAALNTGVAGLVQPAAGRLIDRIGARVVISSAIALLAGAYLLLAVVQELWQFFVVYGVLAGVGFGGASSMAVGVLLSHWYVRRRATVLARAFMGINAELAARVDKRRLIVWLFVLRAVALVLAASADSVAALIAVAIVFGAASFPVIPLISGSISERFWTRAIGAVLGTTFVVHQLGAGLGVLGAGLVRDGTGSYAPALVAAVAALLVGAALIARVSADPAATSRRAAAHDLAPVQPIPQGGTP